jgi:hypothetical protein
VGITAAGAGGLRDAPLAAAREAGARQDAPSPYGRRSIAGFNMDHQGRLVGIRSG